MDKEILNSYSSVPEKPERYQSTPDSSARIVLSIPVKTQFNIIEVIILYLII